VKRGRVAKSDAKMATEPLPYLGTVSYGPGSSNGTVGDSAAQLQPLPPPK
jgi:hypothetical protein